MKHKFFVGLPHQKVHSKFIHSLIGGDFVEYRCGVDETEFSSRILAHDAEDVIWFFNDIYYNLHPRLKGRQVLVGHGFGLGWFMLPRRVEMVNRYFDRVFDTGYTPEKLNLENRGVDVKKIRQTGYTLLFEVPDLPVEPGRVLFASAFFNGWNHHKNLIEILRHLDSGIQAALTVHPETPMAVQEMFESMCIGRTNITYVKTQEQLLQEMARCACAVGQISSVMAPFYYRNKPVILLRGHIGRNPLKGIGWGRVRSEIEDPLFVRILDESTRVSRWRQFSPETLRNAKVSASSRKIFYPINFDREATASLVRRCVEELSCR